jgi:hypothetical protein
MVLHLITSCTSVILSNEYSPQAHHQEAGEAFGVVTRAQIQKDVRNAGIAVSQAKAMEVADPDPLFHSWGHQPDCLHRNVLPFRLESQNIRVQRYKWQV